MENNVKIRQSNFELLRIICMICIIAGHILTQTSAGDLLPQDGADYYIMNLIGTGFRTAINVFVMVGAWFLVEKEFDSRRIINLWLEIFFYSVLIDTACLLFKIGDASWTWEIQAFFPIMGRPIWFGAEYMCMLLMSPFMNKLLVSNINITKKLVSVVGLGMVVCATIFPIEHTTPFFSELLWFCFLYMFIGILKKEKNTLFNKTQAIITFSTCLLVLYGLKLIGDWTGLERVRHLFYYYRIHYETLEAFAGSLALVFIFDKINIGYIKIINILSSVTLAVYLIHQTWAFSPFLWNDIYKVDNYVYSGKLTLVFIGIVVSLYLFAIITETIRLYVFRNTIYKLKIYERVIYILNEYFKL